MDSVKLPDEIQTSPGGQRPAEDSRLTDIIPDEVPRKDGPGGEGSQKNKAEDVQQRN